MLAAGADRAELHAGRRVRLTMRPPAPASSLSIGEDPTRMLVASADRAELHAGRRGRLTPVCAQVRSGRCTPASGLSVGEDPTRMIAASADRAEPHPDRRLRLTVVVVAPASSPAVGEDPTRMIAASADRAKFSLCWCFGSGLVSELEWVVLACRLVEILEVGDRFGSFEACCDPCGDRVQLGCDPAEQYCYLFRDSGLVLERVHSADGAVDNAEGVAGVTGEQFACGEPFEQVLRDLVDDRVDGVADH